MCHFFRTVSFKNSFLPYAIKEWNKLDPEIRNAETYHNGHIFVDSPSIQRGNSTWKVCENYINFERRIHVEIMILIRRGSFDVDSTFKIDKILMSSPRGFFYVVSTSNRRNFCSPCFYSIIS